MVASFVTCGGELHCSAYDPTPGGRRRRPRRSCCLLVAKPETRVTCRAPNVTAVLIGTAGGIPIVNGENSPRGEQRLGVASAQRDRLLDTKLTSRFCVGSVLVQQPDLVSLILDCKCFAVSRTCDL